MWKLSKVKFKRTFQLKNLRKYVSQFVCVEEGKEDDEVNTEKSNKVDEETSTAKDEAVNGEGETVGGSDENTADNDQCASLPNTTLIYKEGDTVQFSVCDAEGPGG